MRQHGSLVKNQRRDCDKGIPMQRNFTPTTAWITGMLCFVFLSSSQAAATGRRVQIFEYPNESESAGSYQPPARVLIDPFLVQLHGVASSPLSEVDLGDLLNVLETTASDYLMNKTKRRQLEVQLEYVKFARLVQEFQATEDTTNDNDASLVSVDVENGVARYTEHPTPDSKSVQIWVQESLAEEYLLPRLQDHPTNANLRSVTGTSVAFKYPALPSDTTAVKGVDTIKSVNDSKDAAIGAIIGSLLGIFVVSLAVAAVWFVRKRRNQLQVVNLGEASEASDADSFKPQVFSNERFGMRRAAPDDGRSVAGSESEWTVATEAGDSMAIKSIHPNGIIPSSPNTSALMLSESFERDRQVALTKDMLTSQWSGQVTNQRGATPSSESVLQPSYFSATMERQNRETRTDNTHLLPDMDSSSYSSSGTNNTERKKSSPRRKSDEP